MLSTNSWISTWTVNWVFCPVSKSNAGQDEKSENAETSGLETDDNDCNESVDKTLDNSLEPMETSITDNGPNGVKDAIREDRKEMGSDEGDESLIADMEILNKEGKFVI